MMAIERGVMPLRVLWVGAGAVKTCVTMNIPTPMVKRWGGLSSALRRTE